MGLPFRAPGLGLAAVLVLLLSLPGAAATAFTGPGQVGTVPVGEGGLTVPYLAGTADDKVFVVLESVPADTCRLVLDENGTYARTGITWTAGDATGYVWADPGAAGAAYRLHAVWRLDLNGNCTVEETETETFWHDPTGRPYVELAVIGDRTVHSGRAGTTIPIRFEIENNGTIGDDVSARISTMSEAFSATSPGKVLDVPVPAKGNASFVFEIAVPEDVKPRQYVIQVTFTADSGWQAAGTTILDVRPSGVVQTDEPDPRDSSPLPPPTVAPEEAPALPPLLLLGIAIIAIARLRKTD